MIEIFSILIPGFLVCIVLIYIFSQDINGFLDDTKIRSFLDKDAIDVIFWILLAVSAYIIGHILFAAGTFWDEVYDKYKSKSNDGLIDKLGMIRQDLCAERDHGDINQYQWSRSVLTRVYPEGFAEVIRCEADSKLFRSLIIPLQVLGIIFLFVNLWLALVILIMSVLAYHRFHGQRLKGCKRAYTHIITLYSLGELKYNETPESGGSS